MRWGLVPFFAKGVPGKYSTINARIETMATSPAYRTAWKRGQRCILPALGFYEWHVEANGGKSPFYIHAANQEVMPLAGLWDRSTREDGTVIESCTIVTMPANPLMAEIHNTRGRMPAILARTDLDAWLSGDQHAARDVLHPYPPELMDAYRVSTRVNTPRNQGEELIRPMPA
jgi:putative SOS response-associated peptidase YedK